MPRIRCADWRIDAPGVFRQDENFRELVLNRQKYLQHQIEQQQNAIIGAVGTAPVQQSGPAGALGGGMGGEAA